MEVTSEAGHYIYFIFIALFSAFVNILYLSSSLFMMEVYDRVLPSRSVPTLVGLLLIVVLLYLFQGGFDLVRNRLLLYIADRIDIVISPKVYRTTVHMQLCAPDKARTSQPLRDLDTLRGFLSGSGPGAFFDLPWVPFYLAICFAFHFWIGVTALSGAIILAFLTMLSEVLSRDPMREAARHGASRSRMFETTRRNAELVSVMGMVPRLERRWLETSRAQAKANNSATSRTATLGALSKMLRMMLQSGVLAVGAYLVINDQASPGVIIAGSILPARALAPVDLAIANWKGFVAARYSKTRLDEALRMLGNTPDKMALPTPQEELALQNVSVAAPGGSTNILVDVSFRLKARSGLGVIGPSGSGKSSLAKLLSGAWMPLRGSVRLDGATLDQWSSEALGRHIGYMPQMTALIDGTIADNIASFDPEAQSDAVIAAACAAGVHDLIVKLPQGYKTVIDENAPILSAGQQQRIALARALYGDPFLVILDEPNSNLDAEGEEALTRAIVGVRNRGGIVVVVAHRPSALAGVDHILMMSGGRVQTFGPKEEVLAAVLKPTSVSEAPTRKEVAA